MNDACFFCSKRKDKILNETEYVGNNWQMYILHKDIVKYGDSFCASRCRFKGKSQLIIKVKKHKI